MTPNKRLLILYWGPVAVYCAAIFMQSSFSTPSVLPTFQFGDKTLHLAAYALLAAMFCRAYRHSGIASGRPFILITIGAVSSTLYGLSDEIHQAFVAVRSAEAADLLADAVGSVLGALAYHYLMARYHAVSDRKSRATWIDKIMNFL